MVALVMSSERSGRIVLEPDITDRLKELGSILGHSSLSQTANYILREHLVFELEAAKEYQAAKARRLKTKK